MIFGYVRCSTIEQAQDGRSTLRDQEAVVRTVAQLHGDKTPMVFSDVGVSGSIPLNERPEAKKLLDLVQNGDTIIAAKLDRMFRSATDALVTVEALKQRGVGVVLMDISSDPVTGNGVGGLFFKIMAAVAEFERERIAERVALGRASKKKRNGHIGGDAPYGFDRQGKGAEAMLVPNDAEQEVITEMAELFSKCQNYHRTAIVLNKRGRTTRCGGIWYAKQTGRILRRLGLADEEKHRAVRDEIYS